MTPSKLNGKSYEWLNHFSIKPIPKDLIDLITKKQTFKEKFFTNNYVSSIRNKHVRCF